MLKKIQKLKQFKTIEKELSANSNKWRFIGSGCYGEAYSIGNNQVCKITTSERETKVADKIKRSNKKYSFLYKIINVFYIKDKYGKFKYGIIITPKYKPLNINQQIELHWFLSIFEFSENIHLQTMSQIKNMIKRKSKEFYCIAGNRVGDMVFNKGMRVFRKYNIYYILRNLKSAKIKPQDIHSDNILKDKDKYILIDLAC